MLHSTMWLMAMAWMGWVSRPAVAQAQTAGPPTPFAPLTVGPAPSQIRLANGAPGPKYWQNRADYDLHATLDTAARTIHGTMTLRYTNHSPDTLPILWFQMEQNAFLPTSDTPGVKRVYGNIIDECTEVIDGKSVPVPLEDHRSEAKATLPRPLGPGETATLHMAWHFVVPSTQDEAFKGNNWMMRLLQATRMGRIETLYRIAQWYPRVNVYDDVKGWNTEPYQNDEEFYLEYGNFTLAVTVPSNYIVAATGTLDNLEEVLTPLQRTRLAQAARTDTIVRIITLAELTDGTAHPKHDGMVTWKFHADNVRDAVFATSPEYQWDATSWNGILAQGYYRLSADSTWRAIAAMTRLTLQKYSERWFPYPYPQVSVVEGLDKSNMFTGGMEYPMLSFNSETEVADHEIGHNWFPMIVGSNERVHGWMDEGFDTFINSFPGLREDPQQTGDPTRGPPAAGSPVDGPNVEDYMQPAAVLQLLRQDILGPAVFDKAFRTYIQRWAYKHPTPVDFMRTFNDVSGRNLDWFWREWFFESTQFDQAIDSVTVPPAGNETRVTVAYRNKQAGVMPLLVRLTFSDGTTQDTMHPVEIWKDGPTYTASYTVSGKTVTSIKIDADQHFPDMDPASNGWTAK